MQVWTSKWEFYWFWSPRPLVQPVGRIKEVLIDQRSHKKPRGTEMCPNGLPRRSHTPSSSYPIVNVQNPSWNLPQMAQLSSEWGVSEEWVRSEQWVSSGSGRESLFLALFRVLFFIYSENSAYSWLFGVSKVGLDKRLSRSLFYGWTPRIELWTALAQKFDRILTHGMLSPDSMLLGNGYRRSSIK
jgi:hypothetical protein